MSETAFIEAILADYEDEVRRLVYADWLEENGDPARAEFLRCDLEASRPGTDGDDACWWRLDGLAPAISPIWRALVGLVCEPGSWQPIAVPTGQYLVTGPTRPCPNEKCTCATPSHLRHCARCWYPMPLA